MKTFSRRISSLSSLAVFLSLVFSRAVWAATTGLSNPIGSDSMTLADLLLRAGKFFLGGVGIFSVIVFIYGGFLLLTSSGKSEQIQKARDTLVWAVLGMAVILLSYSFLNLMWNVLVQE